MRAVLVILIAYLLGSIPFGYLIVRAKEGSDIRQTGSGGTGATNVSRRSGKAAGMLTLLLDALKGASAVVVAMSVFGLLSGGAQIAGSTETAGIQGGGGHGDPPQQVYWWVAGVALAVLIGHIFPIWLGFRGGKGVATGVGVFLVLSPASVLVAAVVFIGVVFLTRYVSLGSILAALAIPLLIWLQHLFVRPLPWPAPVLTAALLGALLIVFAHRENIARLMQGKERKFS